MTALYKGNDASVWLQLRGYRVAIVERRRVEGRTQEWNISRGELGVLTRLDLLSPEQLETAIVTEWVRTTDTRKFCLLLPCKTVYVGNHRKV